jgi:hypothetical protein
MADGRSYTISDEVRTQRSHAATVKAEKQSFLKSVDFMVPKFRLHLNEKVRLNELAQCIKQTFNYDDIRSMYESEHAEHLDQVMHNLQVEMSELRSGYESHISLLQDRINQLETTTASQRVHAASAASGSENDKRFPSKSGYAATMAKLTRHQLKKKLKEHAKKTELPSRV